jgi:hypothetical protein
MKIDSSKLTSEGRIAVRNFGLAAARFFPAISKKEIVPLPFGARPIPRERILKTPRAIRAFFISSSVRSTLTESSAGLDVQIKRIR